MRQVRPNAHHTISPEFLTFYRQARELLGGPAASRVLGFMADWQLYLDESGFDALSSTTDDDGLGIEAFAEWIGESKSTVYRRQAEFRRAFPGQKTPTRMLVEPERIAA